MGLECLVVTGDSGLFGQLKGGLGNSIAVDLRHDTESAVELACRRHLDGIVIDCDDVPGGRDAISRVRKSRSNQQSLILAVVNGTTSAPMALDLGANLVLSKPVQPNRLHDVLAVAVPKMEREHRRYFRYDVDLPVRLRSATDQSFAVRMRNVSEGGLAVKLADPVKIKGVVVVEFEVPSVILQPFHGKADVVWSDSFAMGMRFLYIERESGAALHAWLGSLESQTQFREWSRRAD